MKDYGIIEITPLKLIYIFKVLTDKEKKLIAQTVKSVNFHQNETHCVMRLNNRVNSFPKSFGVVELMNGTETLEKMNSMFWYKEIII